MVRKLLYINSWEGKGFVQKSTAEKCNEKVIWFSNFKAPINQHFYIRNGSNDCTNPYHHLHDFFFAVEHLSKHFKLTGDGCKNKQI